MNFKSYVYCITNLVTGEFYFGSRYANVRLKRHPEEDLLVYYKSSSNRLKDQINLLGIECFRGQVLGTFEDFDECFWFEQSLIKEHFKNPKCFNMFFKDQSAGHKVFSTAGMPKSEEHKKKIGDAQRGVGKGVKPLFVKVAKDPIMTRQLMRDSAAKKHSNRSLEEKSRIALKQAKTLSANHAARSKDQKNLTRLRKIGAFASQSPEQRAEINARRSAAAKKRWAATRLNSSEIHS
jgi:hypothetical protein